MSNLTPQQIKEIEMHWNHPAGASIALLSEREAAEIGQRFPPHIDETGSHAPGMGQAAEWAATQRVMSFSDPIRQALCVQWGYCEKRTKFGGETFQLCLAVADGLLGFATQIPVPMTALSVYLVRRGLLDIICKCSKPS
jgi:hypothetical protein